MDRTIGHYRLLREIGKGGMGVVFEAWDERLCRRVALKLLADGRDDAARRRMLREAQVAAQVDHSKVCGVLDLFQDEGNFALVMEFLEGEPLSARVARGPMPWREAEPIFRDILDALAALHRDDIIHRDLKPANVMLTKDGAKILDFGIASISRLREGQTQATNLQNLSGTARFIAPEYLRGEPLTPAADLFSAAAMFYEVLSGQPAFGGETVAETMYAVLNRGPMPLRGTVEIERAWNWIAKALAKSAEDRYRSAEEMLAALSGTALEPEVHHPARRLVVLPFRMLRPDAELDFLGYSLADAVAASLAGLDTLAVRSTQKAAYFASAEALDLPRIAKELEVDIVLTGSIMTAGERVRLWMQLMEAPGGSVLWASAFDGSSRDLFDLQHRLAGEVLQELMLPLSAREKVRVSQDQPATPRAYECYLRANQCNSAVSGESREMAKELYRMCLTEDPTYAPAWARLGRVLYVEGKFHTLDPATMAEAEEALTRALELNADLPAAHQFYTSLQVDTGRAPKALRRLLTRGRSARADAAVFAGMGHALRYCGLLALSLCAYERARRVDPASAAGAAWTLFYLGHIKEALEYSTDSFLLSWKYWEAGDSRAAVDVLRAALTQEKWGQALEFHIRAQLLFMTGEQVELRRLLAECETLPLRDPEFWFIGAQLSARSGNVELMYRFLDKTVTGGFCCAWQLRHSPVFAPYAAEEKIQQFAAQCETKSREAFDLFRQMDGAKLLEIDATG
ncbi:MAG: protein kinase [Acidobacteria bacterium]|nr:protein kinase [Acidobacteriota bacterium]